MQFLLEALVLTFVGGVIGMAVAELLTWAIPPMPLYDEFYNLPARFDGGDDDLVHNSVAGGDCVGVLSGAEGGAAESD